MSKIEIIERNIADERAYILADHFAESLITCEGEKLAEYNEYLLTYGQCDADDMFYVATNHLQYRGMADCEHTDDGVVVRLK